MSCRRGYVLIELLLGAAVTCATSALLLHFVIAAQKAVGVQSQAADQQQRLRVAAEALRHDLAMAGAGASRGMAMGPLDRVFAPVLPARVGVISPDPELSVRTDRVSIVYVPETRAQTVLRTAMASAASPLAIDGAAPGCVAGTACEFAAGGRAVVYDGPDTGNSHEFFTVEVVDAVRNLVTPSAPLSRAYGAGARVALVTIRTYYFDAANRRLMVYDGNRSDVPLIDHVADVQVAFVVDGGGMLSTSQLVDGPFLGTPPNRFDADLLRVRRVRVTIRLEADSPVNRELTSTVDVGPPNLAAQ